MGIPKRRTRVFSGGEGKWRLGRDEKNKKSLTIFDPEIDIDLMEHVAHAEGARLSQHGKAQVRGRLVVVELVVGGPVRDEGVVVATELAHHVP